MVKFFFISYSGPGQDSCFQKILNSCIIVFILFEWEFHVFTSCGLVIPCVISYSCSFEMPNDQEVSRVAFRAPPFWESNPRVWFIQIESQFRIANITSDETKFHSIVAALDAKTLEGIVDLVESPPQEKQYDAIKARILDIYAKSDATRLRLLLQDMQLGDRKPSQLLNEMRNLARGDIKDEVLQNLWLQRLPLNIQQILSVSNDTLTNLANIADKISEVSPYMPASVSAVNGSSELEALKAELAEVKSMLKSIEERGRRRERTFSGKRERSKSTQRNRNFCWYHDRFADKAKKCVQPCTYAENRQ